MKGWLDQLFKDQYLCQAIKNGVHSKIEKFRDKTIFMNSKAIIERKVLTADQRRVSAVIGGRSEIRVD